MNSTTSSTVELLRERLVEHSNPERAARERAYLKSSLSHLGVPVPLVRREVKLWWRGVELRPGLDLRTTATALWDQPVHELRLASVELLKLRHRQLIGSDLELCEGMVRQAGTWALVDPIATVVVGLVCARPELADSTGAVLDRWATDPDFWLRRTALLSQLRPLRSGSGHPGRFFAYADSLLADPEFFIRKAIGWVLRDTSRRRPQLVFDWLLPRADRASMLTVREAIKHLPDDQQQAVLAGRSAGRA